MLNIDGNKKKKMRKKSFDYDGTKAAWGFQGDDARGPGQGATTPAWVVPPLPPSPGLSRPLPAQEMLQPSIMVENP